MKGFGAIAILCALALPIEAGAQMKSIFRFDDNAKPAARKADREKADEIVEETGAAGDPSSAQGQAGSGRQGLLITPDEEATFPAGPGGDEGVSDPGSARLPSALPGVPAILEPSGSLPPLTLPRPVLRRSTSPSTDEEPKRTDGIYGIIPPRPDLPKPFVYERAPRNVGTVTGYDAAVAPRRINIDPLIPQLPTGATNAPRRPLPRLAPYGHSLPPSRNTPPASIPR